MSWFCRGVSPWIWMIYVLGVCCPIGVSHSLSGCLLCYERVYNTWNVNTKNVKSDWLWWQAVSYRTIQIPCCCSYRCRSFVGKMVSFAPHTLNSAYAALKTDHTWQTTDTINAWLVDYRAITVWAQIQGGSDSAVIRKVNFCGQTNSSSRTCLELNIRVEWKYSALWCEYCVMFCVGVWKLLIHGVRITLIIWVFQHTVRIWECQ
jgi:hypothetical protein